MQWADAIEPQMLTAVMNDEKNSIESEASLFVDQICSSLE